MNDIGLPSGGRIRNISDLAKMAGVSAGTVSRALAGKTLVNTETRERIQAIAKAHGFRPNQMARRLRTQRTGVIGVVVPLGHERRQHLSDPFFMTILGYLADALTEDGYDLMLSRIIPDEDDWLERIVDSGMLDGVLLIGQSDQYEAIERVAKRYRPIVVWGSHSAGQVHCSIGVDNYFGGKLAGKHLIARGCKRIAYLGQAQAPELSERYRGICDAASGAGLAKPLQLDTPLAADLMATSIADHLDAVGDRIDGIAAASDVIAMSALRVLADRKIRVPYNIAVTGFDDLPLAEQTVPRLTTVRQDLATGAQAMVTALFARIGGEDAPSVEMTPTLVVRDTA